MIFDELSNAVFGSPLQCPGAELVGGGGAFGRPPPRHDMFSAYKTIYVNTIMRHDTYNTRQREYNNANCLRQSSVYFNLYITTSQDRHIFMHNALSPTANAIINRERQRHNQKQSYETTAFTSALVGK